MSPPSLALSSWLRKDCVHIFVHNLYLLLCSQIFNLLASEDMEGPDPSGVGVVVSVAAVVKFTSLLTLVSPALYSLVTWQSLRMHCVRQTSSTILTLWFGPTSPWSVSR